MARAGLVLDEPRYLAAAEKIVSFLSVHLVCPDGRLLARWREGEAAHPGKLDDYAFYSWGLLELYGATFAPAYLAQAVKLAGIMLDFFFDRERGGFYPYASDGEQLLTRTKEVYDGAMPSGNSVAALVLLRLARLTGDRYSAVSLTRELEGFVVFDQPLDLSQVDYVQYGENKIPVNAG